MIILRYNYICLNLGKINLCNFSILLRIFLIIEKLSIIKPLDFLWEPKSMLIVSQATISIGQIQHIINNMI